jgi:hypothetical protein
MGNEITNNLGLLDGSTSYQGRLNPGEEIAYNFQIGRSAGPTSSAELVFDHLNGRGDLDLELYRSGETAPLYRSATAENNEFIPFYRLPAGNYTLKLVGYTGVTGQNQDVRSNAFKLKIDAPELTTISDPAGYDFASAPLLNVANTRFNGSIGTADETDYYRFTMSGAGRTDNYLSVQFDAAAGNVNLQLFDAQQRPIDLTNRFTNVKLPDKSGEFVGNAQIDLSDLAAGDYYATIDSADPFNYKLTIDAPQTTPDAWTVMTYVTASNLYNSVPTNIEQMEVLADRVPNSVNLSVLWDQSSFPEFKRFPTPGLVAWGDTGQTTIRAGQKYEPFYPTNERGQKSKEPLPLIVSPFKSLGEKDTGDSQSLTDFVNWSVHNAPAQRNILVMWDHGAGPFGFNNDDSDVDSQGKSIGSDFSTTKLVRSLQETQKTAPLSLLAFDECLMASVEVQYELRNYAPVIVASEEVINETGYEYNDAFQVLTTTNPDLVTDRQLAQSIVDAFEKKYGQTDASRNTLSAVDTAELPDLIIAIREFTAATASATSIDWQSIAAARSQARAFDDTAPEEDRVLRDLGGFMQAIEVEEGISKDIRITAGQVIAQLQQAVFAQTSSSLTTAKGLSIFLPLRQKDYQKDEQKYINNHQSFIDDTNWIEFLDRLFENSDEIAGARNTHSTVPSFDLQAGGANVLAAGVTFDRLDFEKPKNFYTYPFELENIGMRGDSVIVNSNSDATFTLNLRDANNNSIRQISIESLNSLSLEDIPAGKYVLEIATDRDVSEYGLDIKAGEFQAVVPVKYSSENTYRFEIGATGTPTDFIQLYSSNPDATFTLNLTDENKHLIRKISAVGNGTLSLQDLVAGTYTLELEADRDVSNYSLYAKAPGFNPDRKTLVGNDRFEFNGSFQKAANVDENLFYAANYLLAPTDEWYAQEDWYTFTLPRSVNEGTDGAVTVYLADSDRQAILDIYDDTGTLLASNRGSGNIRVLYANIDVATYYFKVSRPDGDTKPLGYSFDIGSSDKVPALQIGNATKDGKNTGLLALGDDVSLNFTLTNKSIRPDRIDEIGVFGVDDARGSINGLKPSEAGYLEAALQRGRTIFSILPDNFIQQPTRIIDGFAPTEKFLSFYTIDNGTRAGVLNDPTLQSKVKFGTGVDGIDTGVVRASALIGGDLSVAFHDGNSAEPSATVSVSLTDRDRPLGAKLQDNVQRELIDLRDAAGKNVQIDLPVVASEAAYYNTVGFYRLENEWGAVKDPLTGTIVTPGDPNYVAVALRNSEQSGFNVDRNSGNSSRNVAGGYLFAPYLIANGTTADVLKGGEQNFAPSVYFAYLGANPDRADHIRLLGDNTWGFEDMPNLGDADYNDIVIRTQIEVL